MSPRNLIQVYFTFMDVSVAVFSHSFLVVHSRHLNVIYCSVHVLSSNGHERPGTNGQIQGGKNGHGNEHKTKYTGTKVNIAKSEKY
jgi:hypothetical protein